MKYNSIREYFYRFHNVLSAILLLPLVAFVVLYWQLQQGNIEGPLRSQDSFKSIMLIAFSFVVVTDWLMSFILFTRGLRATRTLDSLGKKLDRYYVFTVLRFALIATGSLVLAVGFYLTEDQNFTIVAVASLVALLIFWPRPSKVCDDLHLRGDERTMVLSRGDKF